MSECTLPPEGWACTRDAGHDGPCAAKPRTYAEAFDQAEEKIMHKVAEEIWRKDAARIETECKRKMSSLGKLQWTLKSLTADIKQLRFSFSSAEQNQNVRLAVTHLEDALHRLSLVLE